MKYKSPTLLFPKNNSFGKSPCIGEIDTIMPCKLCDIIIMNRLIENFLSFLRQQQRTLVRMFKLIRQLRLVYKKRKIYLFFQERVAIVPQPGICVKTKNTAGNNCYFNLCKLSEIPAPPPIEEAELTRLVEDEDTDLWRLPMTIGEPRREVDLSGGQCFAVEGGMHILTKNYLLFI